MDALIRAYRHEGRNKAEVAPGMWMLGEFLSQDVNVNLNIVRELLDAIGQLERGEISRSGGWSGNTCFATLYPDKVIIQSHFPSPTRQPLTLPLVEFKKALITWSKLCHEIEMIPNDEPRPERPGPPLKK